MKGDADRPHEAPSAGKQDEPSLARFIRAEFEEPVAALRGLIAALADEAAALGFADEAGDVRRLDEAGARLAALVSTLAEDVRDAAPPSVSLRHDLRTPVTSIIGYAELMTEEARDAGDLGLLPVLGEVLAAARGLLEEFDKLATLSRALEPDSDGECAPEGMSEALRRAIEVAERLSREGNPGRAVVGRILVVDDNAAMRDLVSRRLSREGHEVVVCDSGEAALGMAATDGFDCLLLDLMMPGMTGLEVLDRLRAQAATRTVPVIVMSALDGIEAAVRCIEAGADDFLTKPLNETLLRARLTSSLERKFLRDREKAAAERLQCEQARAEALLRNVLPASVVARLNQGATAVADHFEAVTVLFCDIVGFTALSAKRPAAETLDILNAVFSGFDALAEAHGLEKIKTIGDAYMVVGGLLFEADHARRVVAMATEMPAVAAKAVPGHPLAVRIGIETGPAAAGIIGRQKFFYDVWGDTVNTASRLEASAEPGRIHVSEAVRRAIGDGFSCRPRAPMAIKGKGVMQTFTIAARTPAVP